MWKKCEAGTIRTLALHCDLGNRMKKKKYLVLRNKENGNIVTVDKTWFYGLPRHIQALYHAKWQIVIK
ncbi:hypothetical protein MKC66_00085 [[Clostridium] innocuum]|nr:hypothetical protein [[Clostridium] innocuum]QSI25751.1 hypothetical protein GKZ87_09830 [Erysipelotrichaceae bacterium 66202529]